MLKNKDRKDITISNIISGDIKKKVTHENIEINDNVEQEETYQMSPPVFSISIPEKVIIPIIEEPIIPDKKSDTKNKNKFIQKGENILWI